MGVVDRGADLSAVGSRMWYLTSRMRAVWQARSRYLPSWKKSQASPCDIVPSLMPCDELVDALDLAVEVAAVVVVEGRGAGGFASRGSSSSSAPTSRR